MEVFTLSDGWGVSNLTLENTEEQTENPSANSSMLLPGGILPHLIKTTQNKLPGSDSSTLLLGN